MLQLIFSLTTLWWIFLFLYIPACFGLIIIVLLQKGKGQGLAGAFGMGGGMDTIFGPRSSKSLPQKITYASAGIFMVLALTMSILSGKVGRAAAPALIEEVPQATMESLFAPPTESTDPLSVSVISEGEADASETDAVVPVPAPPSLDGVVTEEPAEEIPVEIVEDAAEAPVEAEVRVETPAAEPVVEAEVSVETPVAESVVEAEIVIDETAVQEGIEDTPAE